MFGGRGQSEDMFVYRIRSDLGSIMHARTQSGYRISLFASGKPIVECNDSWTIVGAILSEAVSGTGPMFVESYHTLVLMTFSMQLDDHQRRSLTRLVLECLSDSAVRTSCERKLLDKPRTPMSTIINEE